MKYRLSPTHARLAAFVIIAVCIVALTAPRPADAILGIDFKEAALKVVDAILNVIAKAFSFLMQTAAQFLSFVLVDVNGSVGFYSNPFVRIGWGIVRDVANLAFVPFLLIAAFGTLFRIETYNFRRIVPKLITVALLVNFSLVMTGLVVNISQVLTEYFLINVAKQAGYKDIGNALAQGFHLGSIGEDQELANVRAFETGTAGLEQSIIASLMEIVFSIIAAMIFFFLALAFIVRIVMLWVLMILSPLAIVASVLPATQDKFREWMKMFTHWAVFGISAGFMVYLATILVFALNSDAFIADKDLISGAGTIGLLSSGQKLLGYVTLSVFLMAALATAKAGAGAVAGAVVGAAGGFVTGAVGFGMGAAGKPALRAIRARAGQGIRESRLAQQAAGGLRRAVTPLRRAPIIGGAFGGVHEGLAAFESGVPQKRKVDEYIKRLTRTGMGVEGLAKLVPKTQDEKIGLSKKLADMQGHLVADPETRRLVGQHHTTAMNIAAATGNKAHAETLLRTNFTQHWDGNPQRAQKLFPGKTRAQAIREYAGANSSEEDLSNPNIVHYMDPRNFQALAKSGRQSQQIAALKALFSPISEGADPQIVVGLKSMTSQFPRIALAFSKVPEAVEAMTEQLKRTKMFGAMGMPGETTLESRGTTEQAGGRTGEAPTESEIGQGELGEGGRPDQGDNIT